VYWCCVSGHRQFCASDDAFWCVQWPVRLSLHRYSSQFWEIQKFIAVGFWCCCRQNGTWSQGFDWSKCANGSQKRFVNPKRREPRLLTGWRCILWNVEWKQSRCFPSQSQCPCSFLIFLYVDDGFFERYPCSRFTPDLRGSTTTWSGSGWSRLDMTWFARYPEGRLASDFNGSRTSIPSPPCCNLGLTMKPHLEEWFAPSSEYSRWWLEPTSLLDKSSEYFFHHLVVRRRLTATCVQHVV